MKNGVLVLGTVLLASSCAPAGAVDQDCKVIVNVANPATTLSRDQIMRIFLKKTTVWASGQATDPVDQPTESAIRQTFSKTILGRETSDVVGYWNQLIFSGRALPPPNKASDSDVLSYVRTHPNAIGYVGANVPLAEGVKTIHVLD